MREMTQDLEQLMVDKQPMSRKRLRRKLVWLLLALGLLGGGADLGYHLFGQLQNLQCAKKQTQAQNPEKGFQCLERINSRVSNFLFLFGQDIRQLYLTVFNQFITTRRFEEALKVTEAGSKKFSWDPAFLGNRALALFHLGRYQEALQAYHQFLESPQKIQTEQVNGVRVYLLGGQIYLAVRDFDQAEKCLAQAFSLEPDNAGAHLLYARLEALRQKPDAMAGHYEKVRASDSKMLVWQDFFLLSSYYLNKGDLKKFEEVLVESRRNFPNALGFHLLLGLRFLKEGNYTSAYYEVLMEKEVGFSDAGFFSQAIAEIEKQYKEAFRRQPSEPWLQPLYRFIQGKLAYENHDDIRAHAWFEESMIRQEVHPLQHLYMGRASARLKRVDEALSHFSTALSGQETMPAATAEFAGLYLGKGILDTAKNLWQKAISADPYVAKISDVGRQIAQLNMAPTSVVVPSAAVSAKMGDRLMQSEVNQMVVNQFVQLFRLAS